MSLADLISQVQKEGQKAPSISGTYEVSVSPWQFPNDGEFVFHVYAPSGEHVASGFCYTQEAALEAAASAAHRHHNFPPIQTEVKV